MESGWPHVTLLRKSANREVVDKGIQPHIDLGTGRNISKDTGNGTRDGEEGEEEGKKRGRNGGREEGERVGE